MVRSLITQRASPYRQINLTLSTTLRALCFERVGRTRQSLIIKKSSNCDQIMQMPMRISEARFLRRAWCEMRLRSTGTPFELRLRMSRPGAIWHGCWLPRPTHRLEMDQKLLFWPNRLNLKALDVRNASLSYESLLRHTLRQGGLLRLKALPNKRYKLQRSRETLLCP